MDLVGRREDFPTLRGEKPPAYLDNACVTLKPDSVIQAINDYYSLNPGCGGRSVHRYGTKVSMAVKRSRRKVADLLNAEASDEIVFTKNATHSLNQVAKGIGLTKGDVVLTTDREHNSNLVPWLQMEQSIGIDHRVVHSNQDNTFNLENFEQACSDAKGKLKVVSMSHVGNLDGVATPIKEIAKIAHDHGALVCVDGAQSTPHMKVDVKDLGIDFLAFSIHKMLGPSGMGGLWGKAELLEGLDTIISGGNTVDSATYDGLKWASAPARFEAGLDNYAGIIGAEAAIDYLSELNFDQVLEREHSLNRIMTDLVKDINGVEIVGPEDPTLRSGICSLLLKDLDAHDLSILLDESAGVMVRSGMHCVHSWFNARNLNQGSLRASSYFYNTEDEVRLFGETLAEIVPLLRG